MSVRVLTKRTRVRLLEREEKNMELSCAEYRALVEYSPTMIWRAGTDGKCSYFNEIWLNFTGRTVEEELGDGWAEGVHPEDLDFCINTYMKAFNNHERFEMEYRLKRFDGQYRWINDRGVPFFDEKGFFAGYIGSCVDVTEKIEGEMLTKMARTDNLTGLFNRNYLEYLLNSEFHKARQEKTNFIVMMADVDKFKSINDNFGHSTGDAVLRSVAQKLSENIRKSDIAGRYGGDEFVVILSKITTDEAREIAQRILNSVLSITIGELSPGVSLSIGLACQSDEKNVLEVVEKADRAMYHAKQEGGNRFCLL